MHVLSSALMVAAGMRRRVAALAAAVVLAAVVAAPASAQTIYFSNTAAGTYQWFTTGTAWGTTSSTSGFSTTWNNDGTSSAFFGPGAIRTFTITGSDALVQNTLSGTGGTAVTITAASGGRLWITGSSPTINVLDAGVNAAISVSAPIVTDAGSTLTLNRTAVQNGGFVFGGSNVLGGVVALAGSARLNVSNLNGLAGATGVVSGSTTILALNAAGINVSAPLTLNGVGNGNGSNLHALLSATWSGPVTLAGATNSMAARPAGSLAVSGSIAGGAGNVLVIGTPFSGATDNGGGNTRFSSANSTYSGTTIVRNGGLLIGANAPSGANGALGNATSAVLVGDVLTAGTSTVRFLTDGSFTVGRNITVASTGSTTTIGGNHLSGTSSFTGDISLAKSIVVQSLQATGSASRVNFTGVISGVGFGITKTGTGLVVLSGTNTYTGLTSVTTGTLQIGAGGASGSIAGNADVADGTTLAFNRSDALTYAGVISGSGGVVKAGAGVLSLSGSSSYSGPTAVNAGGLRVNGVLGSGTVSVAAAAFLGGSGTIAGPVVVTGTLSPGNSPGVITLGSVTLGGASTSLIEIDDVTRGTTFDGVDVTTASGLAYGGALSFIFGNGSALANTTLDIFSFTGGASGTFASVSSSGFYNGPWTNLGSGSFQFVSGGQTLTFSQATGDIIIVPEPATLALVGLAGIVGGRRLLRRRRAA
jgi:autotransporter-associated beta strand protein